jgi:hypothetical protein
MLTRKTKIFVISQDGDMSEMTLEGVHNALVGGMKWDEVEMTTDQKEADWIERKWKAIHNVKTTMMGMDHHQAEQVVNMIEESLDDGED